MKLKIVDDSNINMRMSDDSSINIGLSVQEQIQPVIANNYEQLINKPSLDGREIVGNINELDPTVPTWAKQDTKPNYNFGEIEDVDSIPLTFISSLFN